MFCSIDLYTFVLLFGPLICYYLSSFPSILNYTFQNNYLNHSIILWHSKSIMSAIFACVNVLKYSFELQKLTWMILILHANHSTSCGCSELFHMSRLAHSMSWNFCQIFPWVISYIPDRWKVSIHSFFLTNSLLPVFLGVSPRTFG